MLHSIRLVCVVCACQCMYSKHINSHIHLYFYVIFDIVVPASILNVVDRYSRCVLPALIAGNFTTRYNAAYTTKARVRFIEIHSFSRYTSRPAAAGRWVCICLRICRAYDQKNGSFSA